MLFRTLFGETFFIRFISALFAHNKDRASHTTNGFKRELAIGKISELYKWSRNTPGDTQSVKTLKNIFLAMLIRSQLILAKLGVSPNGENPVHFVLTWSLVNFSESVFKWYLSFSDTWVFLFMT